ncbi:hypothetical protein QFC21_006390 [Naganishia friedmannii]|uniref:Uncharacterized protein n=1 Tax=Naganishia friedmannii TaxID=89922 RepID=A0ACC2V2H4_9TREE|nr:hypothetical protein QFC21_006390 [Naganishia friedmannii]
MSDPTSTAPTTPVSATLPVSLVNTVEASQVAGPLSLDHASVDACPLEVLSYADQVQVTVGTPITVIDGAPPLVLNNADLHDTAVMLHADDDTDDHVSVGTDDLSDCEDTYYLEPNDVLRHYWHRGDIKYTISAHGRKFCMTAEEMEQYFGGLNFARRT